MFLHVNGQIEISDGPEDVEWRRTLWRSPEHHVASEPRAPGPRGRVRDLVALVERASVSCGTHGDLRHTTVHEAGHAVAAVQRGIPVVDVVVFDAPVALRELRMTGRVKLDDDRGWRSTAPLPLFEFVLAGHFAERAALGHGIPGGWTEDLTMWRQAVGAFKAQTPAGYEALLGEPAEGVIRRMEAWAAEHLRVIESVAAALTDAGSLTETELLEMVRLSN